jgi:four helix bundle protein
MSDSSFPFDHQRLDVYRVALQLAKQCKTLADRVPRGYRSFADQLIRAAGSTVLLIGEGANRFSKGQKRQRYAEARGECGEVAAALELLVVLELLPRHEAQQALLLAGRVGAMLTRLLQRFA